MYSQNERHLPMSKRLMEDSPVEKMVKRALSGVKDCRDLERNDEWGQGQAQGGKAFQNTALYKQLAQPVVKDKNPSASANVRRETFGHQVNSPYEVDPQTWKHVLPNASITNGVSKKRALDDKGDGAVAVKKRQYRKKAVKLKTTTEVIQELTFSQTAQMNTMGNFELAYRNDPETMPPSAHKANSTQFLDISGVMVAEGSTSGVAVTSSSFVNSPDKSSSHSQYPEYSEEIPQPHSFQQQFMASEFLQSPVPSQSQQQQQGYKPQLQSVTQQNPRTVHCTTNGNGAFGHLERMSSSDLVEANMRLLREIAILRLFIKSQKQRIETLCKQNEAYRKTINQNTFQHELEKIDIMFSSNDNLAFDGVSPHLWGC